ncbi:EAL domain-containing protein [Craterilacuibacter sp. RT1T]|uniref:EAL domain-containing protein n=1 Tax=Craterilacuibacter sp. RT1T TaxID=2942211 RepID=UPI0020BF7679|nr:EAL domain-containing protein [Craterilacuibacter sp. RT1T]MCL6263026.1 EAL domain-containing protein [Craterilacuibacter sp. RT1T]
MSINVFNPLLDRLLVRFATNPALTAIVSVTLVVMPIAVLRALLQVLGTLADMAEWSQLAAQLNSWQELCFALVPLLMNIYLALYEAARERMSPVLCVTSSLMVLMLFHMAWHPDGGVLPDSIPLAILAGFLANVLLKATQRFPGLSAGSQNSLVEQNINNMLGLLAVAAVAGALAFLLVPLSHLLFQYVLQWQSGLDPATFGGGMVYELARGISWLFGINGHHLLRSVSDGFQLSSQLNMASWRAGEAPLNVLSNTFFDVWCAVGGSGSTLSLVLCVLLRSRCTAYRHLARASLPLAAINVNEPLVFGIPIFFNPVMAIPFLLVPLLGYLLAYGATMLGLVPVLQSQVGWMMPPLLNSWMASGGSWAAVFLQLLIIVLGACIYWPFFCRMEQRSEGATPDLPALAGFSLPERKLEVTTQQHNYIAQMHSNFQAQKEVETLQKEGSFELFYQPQIALESGRIVGVEVLLRHKGTDGVIKPPTFIASFDCLGLMPELDFWVLERAVMAGRELEAMGPLSLAVNLSPQTLLDARLPAVLDRVLDRPLPEGITLEVEITESQLINDCVRFSANLQALRARGLRVALDDFGSGYSTLAYLTRYQFDKIKLDRSLVLALKGKAGNDFFTSTVRLCEVCGAEVLAEGVETAEELAQVAASGVVLVQGYYFYRPMPMESLLPLLLKPQGAALA